MLAFSLCLLASPSPAAAPTFISFPGGPRSICGLGDVDKDGCADIAVGVGRSSAAGFDAGAIYILSGKSGKEIARRNASSACEGFGTCLTTLRDFDQDGVLDFAVGAPHWTGYDFENDTCKKAAPGAVFICSGKDGKVLVKFDGEKAGDRFGYSLAATGDVDGDSIADLIVGAPGFGDVYVLSGKDGRRLCALRSDPTSIGRGQSVVGIGDANGDGCPDFAVGSPKERVSGCVVLVSGKDAKVFHTIEAGDLGLMHDSTGAEPYDQTRFGWALAAALDFEGQGKAVLLIGADRSDFVGKVCLYSVADRKQLKVFDGALDWGSRYGSMLDTIADVNGDGVQDFLIANPDDDLTELGQRRGQAPGSVFGISGKSGEVLYKVTGDKHLDRLGYAVAACGDLNADGVPDFVAEAHVWWGEGPYFRAYSGKNAKMLFEFKPPDSRVNDPAVSK